MCDFAADAEAAGILVGRTLTLERVRQLNAKDYFYQMLKDNPEILKIHPGIEDDLLLGAIDCHVHAYPDFVHRAQDMIGVSVDAARAGMRAVAFKDHWNISANAAYLAQLHVEHLVDMGELEQGIEVYGGAGMCLGMNVEYVRQAVKYPNSAKDDLGRLLVGAAIGTGEDSIERAKRLIDAKGDVIVVDARGDMDSGIFGEMMATYFQGAGGLGMIIDGCLRDFPVISRELDLVSTATVCPSQAISRGRLTQTSADRASGSKGPPPTSTRRPTSFPGP